jgi:hypothetical protein
MTVTLKFITLRLQFDRSFIYLYINFEVVYAVVFTVHWFKVILPPTQLNCI